MTIDFDVQVERIYFEEAYTNGYVYGKIRRDSCGKMKSFPVYVELGKKLPRESLSRDGKTEVKYFEGCTIDFFEKEEDMTDLDNPPRLRLLNKRVALISSSQ